MVYIVKVHRRNGLSDKVSGAMRTMFPNLGDSRLVIVESVAKLDSYKKLTKPQIAKLEKHFAAKAKEIYHPDTVDKVEIALIATEGVAQ